MPDVKPQVKPQANAQDNQPQQQFDIHRLYVKDLSFESPNTPDVFNQQDWEPDVNFDLNTSADFLGDNLHEVVVSLTITAKIADKIEKQPNAIAPLPLL